MKSIKTPLALPPLVFALIQQTQPRQFWTVRNPGVFAGETGTPHKWANESAETFEAVLSSISAAAHACNTFRENWVSQCFQSDQDFFNFIEELADYRKHINSYWYYALLQIASCSEEQCTNADELASYLLRQAVDSGQVTLPSE